jgi:hypothetical protein
MLADVEAGNAPARGVNRPPFFHVHGTNPVLDRDNRAAGMVASVHFPSVN